MSTLSDEEVEDAKDGAAQLIVSSFKDSGPSQLPAKLPAAGNVVPIVAIGASAGGLDAIEGFFEGITGPSRRAFVILQHLSPDFKSLMAELLARRTSLSVAQARQGEAVKPNHIYLLPPGKTMTVSGGVLQLTDRLPQDSPHLPIDAFFESLAADQGSHTVGVILSGSGSDGARGSRAILRAGGRVLVQKVESAKFSRMPHAAIDAGADKEVMDARQMADAIERGLSQQAVVERLAPANVDGVPFLIVDTMRQSMQLDLSAYKPATVMRRIGRRIISVGLASVDDYARLVADDPDEQEWLYYDLLIGVTSFFRDAEAFSLLRKEVIPDLADRASRGEEVRIWIPACATGEEAYSIAMLFAEAGGPELPDGNVRIFATDIHRRSLAQAAAGVFAANALDGLPTELVERYFSRRGQQFQVRPALRRLLIFSPHDVIRDPPFTKLDLISCRNFLIYLKPEAQKRVTSILGYALNKGGALLLGPSESVEGVEPDFEALSNNWKLFRKRHVTPVQTQVGLSRVPVQGRLPTEPSAAMPATTARRDTHLASAYEALLNTFVPPSLLIDEHGNLAHSFGDPSPYLRFASGRASLSVLELVHDTIRPHLTAAINRVRRTGKAVSLDGLQLIEGSRTLQGQLKVMPVASRHEPSAHLLVSFESEAGGADLAAAAEVSSVTERIQELERDLRSSQESLHSTIEQLETSNEELQASNEELQASNEELQSTNEELHSVNEELHTVSAEHQRKIAELTELGHDMDSLLSSTDVTALFIDNRMKVRRYTPAATSLFNILPQDMGRPLAHLTHKVDRPDLSADVEAVLESGEPASFEVGTNQGTMLQMDLRPYRNSDGDIEGVAIGFADITALKSREFDLMREVTLLEHWIEQDKRPMAILDGQGRPMRTNAAFREAALEDKRLRAIKDGELLADPQRVLGAGDENLKENLRALLQGASSGRQLMHQALDLEEPESRQYRLAIDGCCGQAPLLVATPLAGGIDQASLNEFIQRLVELERAGAHGRGVLDRLARGLVILSDPGDDESLCDVSGMVGEAAERLELGAHTGSLPLVRRQTSLLSWLIEGLLSLAAATGIDRVACYAEDHGESWRVFITPVSPARAMTGSLESLATDMIGLAAARIRASLERCPDGGWLLDLRKRRGDRMVLAVSMPQAADDAEPAEKPAIRASAAE